MPWRLDHVGTDLIVAASSAAAESRTRPCSPASACSSPTRRREHITDDDQTGLEGDRHSGRGAPNYEIERLHTCCRLHLTLLSIYPHAHYLGKEMQSHGRPRCSVAPTRPLLRIRHWDFHWQQDYRYTDAVPPSSAGRRSRCGVTYDNSQATCTARAGRCGRSSTVPSHPTKWATCGCRVLPRSAADASTLISAVAEREKRGNVTAAELLAKRVPENAQKSAVPGRQLRGGWPRRRGRASPRTRVATRSAIGERAQLSRRRAALTGPGARRCSPPAPGRGARSAG